MALEHSIFKQFQTDFELHANNLFSADKQPLNLYHPLAYVLSLGGKRVRPLLTLTGADLFGVDYKEALGAATAIELLHNFTLIHDDIMDSAPIRRGKPTVHKKWNANTGILSGDAMMIKAYQALGCYKPTIFKELSTLLSETALQICEGQQYDIDFETQNTVSYKDYEHMIAYKTAVLLGTAIKMGAIVSETNLANQNAVYEFGYFLGLAFQLQDDYLDTFGDSKTFGKQIGGDIIENKKTALYVKSLELLPADKRALLIEMYSKKTLDNSQKIAAVKNLFVACGVVDFIRNIIEAYTKKAFFVLETIEADPAKKTRLMAFGQQLMMRNL